MLFVSSNDARPHHSIGAPGPSYTTSLDNAELDAQGGVRESLQKFGPPLAGVRGAGVTAAVGVALDKLGSFCLLPGNQQCRGGGVRCIRRGRRGPGLWESRRWGGGAPRRGVGYPGDVVSVTSLVGKVQALDFTSQGLRAGGSGVCGRGNEVPAAGAVGVRVKLARFAAVTRRDAPAVGAQVNFPWRVGPVLVAAAANAVTNRRT